MNPDFLKKLAEITAQLRSGLTANPLDELQKRATQTGEEFGLQLEKLHAQAGYAQSHPQSIRAQQERMVNSALFALQMGHGSNPEGRPIRAAAIRLPGGGFVEAPTHVDAFMKAGLDPAKISPKDEGFVTKDGKFVSREKTRQLMAKWSSAAVKAQQAERSRQAGKEVGYTSEDVAGKLYANRGTKADPPMTLADMDRIMAQKKGRAALDSVATLGSRLHEALSKNGGFTVDPTGKPLTSGYSVGGGEKAGVLLKKPLADLKPNELQSFLDTNKDKLAPGQAWGGWVDKGRAYIEPADQVPDLNAAQRLGNERGEKAIWDHANAKEIPLKAQKSADAAAKSDEMNDILNKWSSVWEQRQSLKQELLDAPEKHRQSLMHALQNPVTPELPFLKKFQQGDIARTNGASPQKVDDVEEMAYKAFKGPQFLKWLKAGKGMGAWYDTRKTQSQAIDALGDKLGPKAFNDLIDHMAASTAMSRPENNLRRASWWKALNDKGLLDPTALRTSTLAAPEGMGHIAQRAHHFAMADLVQNGVLNALKNPKPASFAENLKMNWRPYTNDTRMATAALEAEPKLALGLAGKQGDATPRMWAYAPMERAAQRAAAELHGRGLIDSPPDGVDPTAAWQAQVWGGIGASGDRGMGLKPSKFGGNFHSIVDHLLARSAKMWGVSPAQANELFWKGQPLDLPLDASLLNGPARPRKK